jgi:hypothetical protein
MLYHIPGYQQLHRYEHLTVSRLSSLLNDCNESWSLLTTEVKMKVSERQQILCGDVQNCA